MQVSFGNSAQLKRLAKHCAYCGVKFTPNNPSTFDHVVPASRGGLGTVINGAMSCRHCNNNLKGDLTLDEFFIKNPKAKLHFFVYLDELKGKFIDGVNYSRYMFDRFIRNS